MRFKYSGQYDRSTVEGRREGMRRLYRQRCPWATASACETLRYHLPFLVDFTWQTNEVAKLLAASQRRAQIVTMLLDNDVFICIEICAEAIQEVFDNPCEFPNKAEFFKCWSAFLSLLKALRNTNAKMTHNLTLQSFLMLFIASLILKASLDQRDTHFETRRLFLSADDLFLAKTFPIGQAERSLVKGFPHELFEKSKSFMGQLESAAQNLEYFASKIR